ncbi:LLM class flavin-dependent oxidoreductase [Pseudonocardia abyssalis]|jgi:alkanesulfonate monooxygenase SsuD/methylene tetrahydromethanopterin reductase-like flavin-dependent oxidoreductase (luciferase family)|uniref:LLM class flavin-dependent oxidoreductase n=1 Tax=Pseudonocardia abyssalis TaxID=2792008 RepID=A0ABS6UM66_9PSEU|nr:LLM class flavin-dependent oxidoreductase [Pseudonocardia abyssalis]MBW0119440.1 LLM class flavin-dependent oxidoreductase [Pseudonocardia abyssalis]MBW0133340.1 LLM class flavin-dependent oxidoreductase [Pseudonocardia abyssalis]
MRTAHLAVEVSGFGRHPEAWRQAGVPREALLTPAHHIAVAQLAAQSGADFVALPDSFGAGSGLDAVAIAARVAPVVPGIGLVPTVTTTHTEPFHTSKAIATLDLVSSGRAGWEPAVSRTAGEAAQFGRKPAAEPAELWREAAETIEVVVALWDSWEDDAVIRDVATGRYVDRDKLHYVDFSGEFFSVKGPSITPRSPQAHPLIVLRAEPDSLAVAARWADVVRITAPDLSAAHAARERIRAAVTDAGRDPDAVAVLLDVEILLAADENAARRRFDELGELAEETLRVVGSPEAFVDVLAEGAVDGVTAIPLTLPGGLRVLADEVAPRLLAAGLRTPADPAATLRERFGLPRPANVLTGA